jgi:hypothetical protein
LAASESQAAGGEVDLQHFRPVEHLRLDVAALAAAGDERQGEQDQACNAPLVHTHEILPENAMDCSAQGLTLGCGRVSEPCAAHPARPATHRCGGAAGGSATLRRARPCVFCRHCRERALPRPGAPPPVERQRRQVAMRVYSLADALAYPLRGSGKLMFAIVVVSSIVVGWIARFGIGLKTLVLVIGWWSLLVGLQFKIVRDTAKGADRLPLARLSRLGRAAPDLFA